MKVIEKYQEGFSEYLKESVQKQEPANLYEPIRYILNIGGKRIRPCLVMLATDVFGTEYKKGMDAALAVELFHNFSLMHDDIMDKAPLRRGKETVHTKWNLNIGILSGDTMQILAYQFFERYEPEIFKELAMIFTKTALEVCEGQQYDLDFETKENVSAGEYYKMIEYKTAVLLGAALKMGGVIAKTGEKNKEKIYDFGINLGIAFQLQDDYLDTFGDEKTFGKRIGGDILENKKTILYIKALENSDDKTKKELLGYYTGKDFDESEKIEAVTEIFKKTGSRDYLQGQIREYTEKALDCLKEIEMSQENKEMLKSFGLNLMHREV